eukprot:TRINITY_DN10761_c0_g1_i1.p1 TRINITY_DN10761_c0_g1~~TRINITY_DN10761_c0_g1_i1.p1  ORF type:complete len:224 (-),score=28.80 TRINITY_DN10761_c0_g1_i1:120-761(-)
MGAQSNRNTFFCAISIFLFLVGIVLFLLGGGQDSPNAVGAHDIIWTQANCTVIEHRTQLISSGTERLIFRVNVSSLTGDSLASDVTAVAGEFGWGGYHDNRKSNTEETRDEQAAKFPKGSVQTCFYSGDFVGYPSPVSCKRCTELVYFHYSEEEMIQFQFNWMIFVGFGIASVVLGAVATGLGVASVLIHQKKKRASPQIPLSELLTKRYSQV